MIQRTCPFLSVKMPAGIDTKMKIKGHVADSNPTS